MDSGFIFEWSTYLGPVLRVLLEQVGILAANCCGLGGKVPEVSGFFLEFPLGWRSEPGADDTDKTVGFIMNRTVLASGRPKFEWVMKRLFRRGDIPSAASVLSLKLET